LNEVKRVAVWFNKINEWLAQGRRGECGKKKRCKNDWWLNKYVVEKFQVD
jgi:hypothetical protein